jgi:hypothetical protein
VAQSATRVSNRRASPVAHSANHGQTHPNWRLAHRRGLHPRQRGRATPRPRGPARGNPSVGRAPERTGSGVAHGPRRVQRYAHRPAPDSLCGSRGRTRSTARACSSLRGATASRASRVMSCSLGVECAASKAGARDLCGRHRQRRHAGGSIHANYRRWRSRVRARFGGAMPSEGPRVSETGRWGACDCFMRPYVRARVVREIRSTCALFGSPKLGSRKTSCATLCVGDSLNRRLYA